MEIYLRNTLHYFLLFFFCLVWGFLCFHFSVSHIFIIDWRNYRRWWSILNFSLKILVDCYSLPSSQASFCTLEAFFLHVCFFLPVLREQRDGKLSLAVCTHVSRTSWGSDIPVSLSLPWFLMFWHSDESPNALFFGLLDWFHMWNSFQMSVLNTLVYLLFAWHIEQNSISCVYKMTYLEACNSAASVRWLGNL